MSFWFGDFELDQERRQLLRSGERVPLEPKAYELLCLLLDRHPRALSRAQIRDVIWSGTFVSESTLAVVVNGIRHALGDDAHAQRFVRTVHGFGYAFCGEVRQAGEQQAAAPRQRRPARPWALLAAAGVVVVAGTAGAWWWRTRAARPSLDPRRVAVALFENRTGDPALDPLGRTVADRISEGLARIDGLQVAPGPVALPDPGSVGALGERSPVRDPIAKLAADTGAGLVVSGICSLDGGNLSIRPRLTVAVSGQLQVLSPASAPRSTPGTAVEAARERVLGAVATQIDPFWQALETDPPTYSAYREFLASNEIAPLDFGYVGHLRPIPYLRRTLELDPDFVVARLHLASWLFSTEDYAGASREIEVLESRRATLSPVGRLHVDAFRAKLDGRNGDAYVAAREARKLRPLEALAAFRFAMNAADANRVREAVEALTAPLDWAQFHARSGVVDEAYFWYLITMLHRLGEHDRELPEVRRGQRLHPEVPWLLGHEAYTLAALGRLDELERVLAERLSLASPFQRAQHLMFVGLELRVHGQRSASDRMLARSLEAFRGCTPEEAKAPATMWAVLLRSTGRLDEAQRISEQAFREAPADTAWTLAGDLGVTAAARGDRVQALRISAELGRLDRPFLLGRHTFLRACIAAQLGNKDEAMNLLRTAFAQGYGSQDQHWTHLEPSLETLRGTPPYEELMRPR